ncbi:MAG TPA: 1,2-phenylacetyl-CoA epoxidase subunit PaaC [Candidatus Saccharimonadales bacterium]|nr:1,2-phenylacetyl-CoA epoxidase subunit PaaC [Candidatus Saccharimonadales bacterium]
MSPALPMAAGSLAEFLLRLADDRLVLGHRLSEWCGHAPIPEEDIAMANLALDCLGHASLLLEEAGRVEGRGRDADQLAYGREVHEFRNCLLVEQPNRDFAATMVRQFLVDVHADLLYGRLEASAFEPLRDIAAKARKEVRYHRRHSGEWLLRLGDGTEESHARTQAAVDGLWKYTGELFQDDELARAAASAGVAPEPGALREEWHAQVAAQAGRATLRLPQERPRLVYSGRAGRHTEALGHLLTVMQSVARAHPGAAW